MAEASGGGHGGVYSFDDYKRERNAENEPVDSSKKGAGNAESLLGADRDWIADFKNEGGELGDIVEALIKNGTVAVPKIGKYSEVRSGEAVTAISVDGEYISRESLVGLRLISKKAANDVEDGEHDI